MFAFETVNPLRKRKVQKYFSLCNRFSEEFMHFKNFGATLGEVLHFAFHYTKRCFSYFISRVLFFYLISADKIQITLDIA